MSRFLLRGVIVQPVALELDDKGRVVAEHPLQGEMVYEPVGLNLEDVVRRKMAELENGKGSQGQS
jgi:hypothetical protein